jgi:predicted Kef-type K+ transport protein
VRDKGRVVFTAAVAAVAAWALLQTAGWPIKTALYPRAVAIPLLALAVAETVLSLRCPVDREEAEAVDVVFSDATSPQVAARRTAAVLAWIGGFYLAIMLIGFPRAIPLFVFGYLKGQGKESWWLSVLLAALAWAGFDLLFVRLLHTPFADGLIWRF